jgi:hypothetical protein
MIKSFIYACFYILFDKIKRKIELLHDLIYKRQIHDDKDDSL